MWVMTTKVVTEEEVKEAIKQPYESPGFFSLLSPFLSFSILSSAFTGAEDIGDLIAHCCRKKADS